MAIDLEALYKDLHANPELSFRETRTAGIAAEAMHGLGLEVTTGVARTGVIAVLPNGPGPVVYLRADMDGLPVEERTGLDYASSAHGLDAGGEDVPVMHACGHDMHVTWLIGAIEQLATERAAWSGTVVAVFQPAEETIGGARELVADGLLDRFPRPDVVMGQHVAPLPSGTISLTSGPAMAASDSMTITLHGQGGHGSRPQTTIDPVVAAAMTVVRLQTVVSREVDPAQTAVLTVGSLHAGTRSNIIPAEATLALNLRSSDEAVRTRLLAAVRRIVDAEAAASGMTTPPSYVGDESAPVTVNEPAATARIRTALTAALGPVVGDWGPVSGSEDVGVLASAANVPLVFWFTGGSDAAKVTAAMAAGTFETDIPSNHSPFFAPVLHPTIELGVQALVVATKEWLPAVAS